MEGPLTALTDKEARLVGYNKGRWGHHPRHRSQLFIECDIDVT
jgi:hypothetical protein